MCLSPESLYSRKMAAEEIRECLLKKKAIFGLNQHKRVETEKIELALEWNRNFQTRKIWNAFSIQLNRSINVRQKKYKILKLKFDCKLEKMIVSDWILKFQSSQEDQLKDNSLMLKMIFAAWKQ